MTAHTSKGLEFDIVILTSFNEGVFPSYRTVENGDESAVEEERRLAL